MWIDTHCHIDKLKLSPEEILNSAKKSDVFCILTIGTELEDWSEVLSLSEKHSPFIYGTLGMHPHTAQNFDESCETFLNENLSSKAIVGVGEIGLDYFYNNSPKDKQKEVFDKQLDLARSFQLPVEIHTRSAEKDTLFFLKKYQSQVRGLLHCFTGSYDLAKKALDYGFNISFSGILTFKNSESLRETCKKIPLDRIHIETDSPFLAPAPYRGRENQPSYVSLVADCVAKIHQVSLDQLSQQLKENTYRLFPKIQTKDNYKENHEA